MNGEEVFLCRQSFSFSEISASHLLGDPRLRLLLIPASKVNTYINLINGYVNSSTSRKIMDQYSPESEIIGIHFIDNIQFSINKQAVGIPESVTISFLLGKNHPINGMGGIILTDVNSSLRPTKTLKRRESKINFHIIPNPSAVH